MNTKFIPSLKIFALSTAIFAAIGFNPLNAEKCPIPEGPYKEVCLEISVESLKKGKKCRVKATCPVGGMFFAFSPKCHVIKNDHDYCHAHWDWDPNKDPTPRLKNARGWLKPE